MEDDTTYLLSSFKNNPDRLFQGYCFDRENLIFGQSGADSYFNKTGKEISFGEDGCYVLAKKIEGGYLIGSDSAGYKKILYFKCKKSGSWVVSNSLNLMVEHLAINSIIVTPNISSLLMMSIGLSVFQQPVTYSTIANEIKILPNNTLLTIGNNIFDVNKNDSIVDKNDSYRDMLISFSSIWISRFFTILSHKGMLVEQGLTGGLDSRAVFSLSNLAFYYNKQVLDADYRLITGLTRGDDTDLRVAQKITKHYGYQLNDKSDSNYKEQPLDSREKYLDWKNICLGLYHPIYFPKTKIDYKKISIGGGGGENYRPFYGKNPKLNSYRDFVENIGNKIKELELRLDLTVDLYETLLKMQEVDIGGNEVDPLILHYKHFRTRFHSGLFPQYRVSFTPLSSKYLANIAVKKNTSKVETSQILYDLINLTDELISFDFDTINKKPNKDNLEYLTFINNELDIKKGSVFVGETITEKSNQSKSIKPVLQYLKEDFDKACTTDLVKKLWDNKFISKATSNLNEAIRKGKFNHAADGIPVSTIIATGMFKDVAGK